MTGESQPIRIGIAGSGFIARHFAYAVEHEPEFEVAAVLTRSDLGDRSDFPRPDLLTNEREQMVERSDVILECTGDAIAATDTVDLALSAGLPVVTMNTEFHITSGSYFVGRGVLTEAEGDQPGCLASLAEDAVAMGFRPLVYGNMKGFLNHHPTPEEMEYWGGRQGISLPMVTSFTDGTKIQAEQALVANGLGGVFAQPGMLGPAIDDLREGGSHLAAQARQVGSPIADYLLSGALPHGVFLVAEHDERQAAALEYYKMGPGPDYTIIRNNIFVHLEIMKSIRRAVRDGHVLLDNSATPRVSVAGVAKRRLEPGTRIEQAIGSFDVRGVGVHIAEEAGHAPVGLIAGATISRAVEAEGIITMDDLDLPDSLALRAWQEVESRVLAGAVA